tara:strand:- start:62 stop:532 length:471 start_codon:yes stop_codon:yes gene_type:complete
MNLDEIRARLYSSTGITPVAEGPGWGRSKIRDENAARLAAYEGYTGLDKIAMDVMKQGYNVEDPTKTMTGLLQTLAPNLSGWPPSVAAPRVGTQIAMSTGLIPKTDEENVPGIIAMLAGSYTDRIQDYLTNFQDLPDIRAAVESIDDEDKLADVWT